MDKICNEEEKKLIDNINYTFKRYPDLFAHLKKNTVYSSDRPNEDFYNIKNFAIYESDDLNKYISIADIFLYTGFVDRIGVPQDLLIDALSMRDYDQRLKRLNDLFEDRYRDVTGVYFRSPNDQTTDYLIEFIEEEPFHRVKVYTTTELDLYYPNIKLKNGDEITMDSFELKWVSEVQLCNKYFFPKFNNELQLYYEDKHRGFSYPSNSILSLAEAINYAIDYGITKGNIKLY